MADYTSAIIISCASAGIALFTVYVQGRREKDAKLEKMYEEFIDVKRYIESLRRDEQRLPELQREFHRRMELFSMRMHTWGRGVVKAERITFEVATFGGLMLNEERPPTNGEIQEKRKEIETVFREQELNVIDAINFKAKIVEGVADGISYAARNGFLKFPF